MLKNCSTCGKQTREYSEFPVPTGTEKVVRCKHCRQISAPYSVGGVQGP